MGKLEAERRQVDVTYVKRGQLAEITRMRPGQQSERAQQALAAAQKRRSHRGDF